MKKVMHLVSIIMFFSLLINYVQADCTNEEIGSLKKEVEKIKVTYKHLGAVEDDDGITVYDRFNVTFNNVNDDLYISALNSSYIKYSENGIIFDTFTTGTWNFNVYSNKCEEMISEVKVVLPNFNIYSLDPLCEGISGDDFALCGKYYNANVSYDSFKERVESYRRSYAINSKSNQGEKINVKDFTYYFRYISSYVLNNLIYFISVLGIFIIILIIIKIIKTKRNRGVLK